jgi:hypothetical protein
VPSDLESSQPAFRDGKPSQWKAFESFHFLRSALEVFRNEK